MARISWHPAFVQAIQQELEDYLDVLTFESEHQLTTEPLRIDVLIVKKKRNVVVAKNRKMRLKKSALLRAHTLCSSCLCAKQNLTSSHRGKNCFLPEEDNLWLNSLRNDLSAAQLERFALSKEPRVPMDAYFQVIGEANIEAMEELQMRKKNGVILSEKLDAYFTEKYGAPWIAVGEARGEAKGLSMNWNNIYNEDCVAGMQKMEAGSVDLVFTDPPFNIGYSYDVYHDKLEDNEYLQWSKTWMSEVCRILKPTGTFWLAIGDEFAAELKVCATRELGLTCRSWVVWYYTFGVNCTKKFTRSHVHLFHFVKDPNKFTFNDEAVRVPSARQLIYNDKRANPKGRLPDDTWILRPQELEQEFGFDKDTWHVSRVCGTFKERQGWHGCQMPEAILERIISVSSNEGEKVLDPFLGSGTTVVAAKKLNRQYLGFELSPEYWEQCRKRLENISLF